MLFVRCCLLFVRCSVFVAGCCLLFVVCCVVRGVLRLLVSRMCYVLFDGRCLFCVGWSVLFVLRGFHVWCLLFVVRCVLFVA